MWSWLPDELLQRIVQLVAERAPRALAIVVLLDQRSRASAAARLARMKPLLTAPFRLTVQRIFDGSGTLDLSGRALRSEGMEVLGLALVSGALDKLTRLRLDSNQIGDAGLQAFADALGKGALDNLRDLYLDGNSIGDDGMIALAKAITPGPSGKGALASLKDLYLFSNQISDAGVSALADAVGSGALDHLQHLFLGNNKCSQQSKDMLKTAMSKTNCSIIF